MFDNIQKLTLTNAHGEVNFHRIDSGKLDLTGFTPVADSKMGFIVGHSESGHHHVLEREGVTMREKEHDGMKVLYAILENPCRLFQAAGDPHKAQTVEPGEYIITNNVEYDPWTQQARRVAD
jgi:hypothetical protein